MKIEAHILRDLDRFFTARKYGQAITALTSILEENPNELSLRMKLADAYALHGNKLKAVEILTEIAKQLAKAGYITKAIAIQKKIQRIKPDADIDIYKYIEEVEGKPDKPVPAPAATPKERPDNKVKALDGLFKGLSKEEFKEVFSRLEEKQLEAGDYVFREGEEDNSVFIIISGTVKVLMEHGDEMLELATLNESDFFGEVALLTGKCRTASVMCITHAEFLVLNRDNYNALSKKYKGLQESLAAALEFRAQKTIEKLIEN